MRAKYIIIICFNFLNLKKLKNYFFKISNCLLKSSEEDFVLKFMKIL